MPWVGLVQHTLCISSLKYLSIVVLFDFKPSRELHFELKAHMRLAFERRAT
jgi:hypothetical protein